ncbi:hypothetical protein ASPBRDRAFT_36133 [Aspergillus brasiliensis CBS 101740]|uniref:Uncharacterized protein n=1 Tax=Aspergillus brasiliensis (strain CBS 101740 / IMI 381727 / IBT 21946) TaxID=767769 RepID=A0A1L9UZ23_ASPBC|nr:hypothetical protein ASPBRDRAFT_36133 [Aspergillus brasiliensis CBS 101740]
MRVPNWTLLRDYEALWTVMISSSPDILYRGTMKKTNLPGSHSVYICQGGNTTSDSDRIETVRKAAST